MNIAYRMGRGIKAGRVWTNCYHLYPAPPPAVTAIRHRPGNASNDARSLPANQNLLVLTAPRPWGSSKDCLASPSPTGKGLKVGFNRWRLVMTTVPAWRPMPPWI